MDVLIGLIAQSWSIKCKTMAKVLFDLCIQDKKYSICLSGLLHLVNCLGTKCLNEVAAEYFGKPVCRDLYSRVLEKCFENGVLFNIQSV